MEMLPQNDLILTKLQVTSRVKSGIEIEKCDGRYYPSTPGGGTRGCSMSSYLQYEHSWQVLPRENDFT